MHLLPDLEPRLVIFEDDLDEDLVRTVMGVGSDWEVLTPSGSPFGTSDWVISQSRSSPDDT
jgi:hypothetical protein